MNWASLGSKLLDFNNRSREGHEPDHGHGFIGLVEYAEIFAPLPSGHILQSIVVEAHQLRGEFHRPGPEPHALPPDAKSPDLSALILEFTAHMVYSVVYPCLIREGAVHYINIRLTYNYPLMCIAFCQH